MIAIAATPADEFNRALEYTISFLSLPSVISGRGNTEYRGIAKP